MKRAHLALCVASRPICSSWRSAWAGDQVCRHYAQVSPFQAWRDPGSCPTAWCCHRGLPRGSVPPWTALASRPTCCWTGCRLPRPRPTTTISSWPAHRPACSCPIASVSAPGPSGCCPHPLHSPLAGHQPWPSPTSVYGAQPGEGPHRAITLCDYLMMHTRDFYQYFWILDTTYLTT